MSRPVLMLWNVRTYFRAFPEALGDVLVYDDAGPFDRVLAELVLADIGIDGTMARGLGRVRVERAILVAV
jgi:hypothetical protein